MLYAQGWDETKLRKSLRKKKQKPQELADFILARHKERFLEPLKELKTSGHSSQGYGFSILAICSLLIETVQSYRDGLPTTDKKEFCKLAMRKNIPPKYRLNQGDWTSGVKAFRRFFVSNRAIFAGMPGTSFYRKVRCGILHQGQTKHGWVVKRKGTGVWRTYGHAKLLFRDNFVEALNEAFQKYIERLRNSKCRSKICENAARRVWWLMKLS